MMTTQDRKKKDPGSIKPSPQRSLRLQARAPDPPAPTQRPQRPVDAYKTAVGGVIIEIAFVVLYALWSATPTLLLVWLWPILAVLVIALAVRDERRQRGEARAAERARPSVRARAPRAPRLPDYTRDIDRELKAEQRRQDQALRLQPPAATSPRAFQEALQDQRTNDHDRTPPYADHAGDVDPSSRVGRQ